MGVSAISSPSIVTRPRAAVDDERTDLDHAADVSCARRTAARDRTDARDELTEPERLDDVVVRAELEPDDAVDLVAARGDDDDRHVRLGTQLAAQVEPVEVGQTEIEQDDVRPRAILVEAVERAAPRVAVADGEPLSLEAPDERDRDVVVVFDQEYIHPQRVGALSPPPLPNLGPTLEER